jgi:hypothetical protein
VRAVHLGPALLLALPLCALACSSGSTDLTSVVVQIEADPGIAADTQAVHIEVFGATSRDNASNATLRRELWLASDGGPQPPATAEGLPLTWPIRLVLAPLDGDTSRAFRVRATAVTAAGDALAKVQVLSSYREGEALEIFLRFQDACRDVLCTPDTTCHGGTCTDDWHEPGGPPMGGDAGIDAGLDAGLDAEVDAGPDAEVDAGTDAEADAGTDAEVDAGPVDPCVPQEGDETYHYLLRVIRLERDIENDPDSGERIGGEVVGMDLDGVDGVTCGHVDFGWQGERGIDNNFAPLADDLESLLSMNVNESMAEAIVEGDLLMVVRVDKWNGTPNDACVDVSVLTGLVPAGVGNARAYLDMDDDGLVDPGVTLNFDAESFREGMVPVTFFEGQRVEDGRVLTDPGTLPMEIHFGADEPLDITLKEARLRFDLSLTTLSNGILAGAADVEEAHTGLMNTGFFDPVFESTLRNVLETGADLWGDGVCDHMSVGFYIEGVDIVPGDIQ